MEILTFICQTRTEKLPGSTQQRSYTWVTQRLLHQEGSSINHSISPTLHQYRQCGSTWAGSTWDSNIAMLAWQSTQANTSVKPHRNLQWLLQSFSGTDVFVWHCLVLGKNAVVPHVFKHISLQLFCPMITVQVGHCWSKATQEVSRFFPDSAAFSLFTNRSVMAALCMRWEVAFSSQEQQAPQKVI